MLIFTYVICCNRNVWWICCSRVLILWCYAYKTVCFPVCGFLVLCWRCLLEPRYVEGRVIVGRSRIFCLFMMSCFKFTERPLLPRWATLMSSMSLSLTLCSTLMRTVANEINLVSWILFGMSGDHEEGVLICSVFDGSYCSDTSGDRASSPGP
jgi:hypothetical protein